MRRFSGEDERADNNTGLVGDVILVAVVVVDVRCSETGRSVSGTGSDRKSIVLVSSAQSSSSSYSSFLTITGDVAFVVVVLFCVDSDLEDTPVALTTGSGLL